MNQDDATLLANARNSLERLGDLNTSFLSHVRNYGGSPRFPNSLGELEGTLTAAAFGHELRAAPRPVRTGLRDFAMEYTFHAKFAGEDVPVWTFYLLEQGELFTAPSNGTKICDFNNRHLGEQLLVPLNLAILQTELFAPRDAASS